MLTDLATAEVGDDNSYWRLKDGQMLKKRRDG